MLALFEDAALQHQGVAHRGDGPAELRYGGAQQLPLLIPAQGGLFLGQALEGGVEVQVRRVEYAYHVNLTASARVQAPVSLSSSKSAPSSLQGPGAQS